MAERDHHRARQGRDVDDRFGLVALRVGQRIGQNQSTFRIGVQHLDRLPGHAFNDVARLGRPTRRQVFAGRNQSDDVELRFQLRDRPKHPEHRRRSAHVELHLVHVGGRLDRNSAAVERDALPDQDERPLLSHRLLVLHDDEARRLLAAVGDRQERAHAEVLELFALEDPHLDVGEFAPELHGPIRQIGWRAYIARQIAEIARGIHPVRDREPARRRRLACREIRALRHR